LKIKYIVGHLKTVLKHKWWVFYYCCRFGIPWRGIKHDLSKFSPTEFFESVKYYTGTRSPIDACKEDRGYSKAWLHHKGRNKHHYEYWQDNFDNGGQPLIMPYKESLEMLCDYLGAGRAYSGKDFTFEGELKWWRAKTSKSIAMHWLNQCFIDDMLLFFVREEKYNVKCSHKEEREYAKTRYNYWTEKRTKFNDYKGLM
jgi:hypothetical protein